MLGNHAASAAPISAFCCCIVRSAAAMSGRRSSSVEGKVTGTRGMPPAKRARPNAELGRRPSDQDGDGVLELRPRDARVVELRLRGRDLRVGGADVALRHRIAGLELIIHDRIIPFVFLDRAGQQSDQRIRGAQIEISGRQRGLRGELGIIEIGGAHLSARGIALDLPADPAPDVESPAAVDRRGIERRIGRCRPGVAKVVPVPALPPPASDPVRVLVAL